MAQPGPLRSPQNTGVLGQLGSAPPLMWGLGPPDKEVMRKQSPLPPERTEIAGGALYSHGGGIGYLSQATSPERCRDIHQHIGYSFIVHLFAAFVFLTLASRSLDWKPKISLHSLQFNTCPVYGQADTPFR